MDPGLALKLAATGEMPNLASLLDRSWSAPVTNPEGLLVGGVWPTYWTGCGPGHHGFYCFRQIENRTYEVARRTPTDVTIPPLWNAVSDTGARCAIIDAPVCAVTPDVNGVQLFEWGTHDRSEPLVASTQARRRELSHGVDYPIFQCDYFLDDDHDHAALRDALLAGIQLKRTLIEGWLDDGPWDLFVMGHSESHCAGHHFWSYHDPSHPAHEASVASGLGDPVVEIYQAIDGALGAYLERLEGAERVFVVMSHGMGPHYDGVHFLGHVLMRLDDALFPPPRSRVVREQALRYVGRRRRVREDRQPLDGSRHFYKVPNNTLYGGIRINLKGREPRGIVAPGAEADALVELLRTEFKAMTDPESGRPVVRDVLRTSDLHPGPAVDDLPDLLVDWIRTAPITGACSPTIGTVHAPYDGTRTGDHRPTGLLLVSGRDVRPGRETTPVRSIDFAPTVAATLGVDLTTAQGTPIVDLVGAQK